MATDLTTPSNTTAKVRWHEQYVSEGINKKLNGIIPAGVVRGGRLGTSLSTMSVTIEADPLTGDSIYSYIDANGHQVTFRQVGNVTLDVSALASTVIFIALQITYVISADTVVKWRAFSQAEIDADPTLVVLGMVDVPASGLIPASDIYPAERREAWTTISPHIREWRQLITNGSFETCIEALASSPSDDFWPDWDLVGSYGLFTGIAVSVVSGASRSGNKSLQLVLSGSAGEEMELYWAGQGKVFPGQLVSVSVWVSGSVLAPGPGANGRLGLKLQFFNKTAGSTGTEYISDITLSGTFGYTEIQGIVEVPASTVSMWVSVVYDDDNQNSTGTIQIDDVRVFLETGEPTDEYPGANRDDHFGGSIRSLSLDIPPQPPATASITTLISRMLRFRQNTIVGGVLPLLLGARDGSTPFDLHLQHGGIDIPRVISDLGSDLIGTLANCLIPRVKTDFPDELINEYTLMWHAHNATAEYDIRVYIAESSGLQQFPSIVITHNAYWDGSLWHPDDTGRESIRRDIGYIGSSMYERSAGTGNWTDANWNDGGVNSNVIHILSKNNFGVLQGFQWMTNGIFGFQDTVAGASPLYSNPDYDQAPVGNALYAKNIVKAWLNFGWSANTPYNYDGFNLELVNVGQYMQFVFGTAMQNDDYAILFTADEKNTGNPWNLIYPSTSAWKLTTGFDATLLELDEVGPTISEVNFNSTSGIGSVVVLARQDT